MVIRSEERRVGKEVSYTTAGLNDIIAKNIASITNKIVVIIYNN